MPRNTIFHYVRISTVDVASMRPRRNAAEYFDTRQTMFRRFLRFNEAAA